MHVQIKRLTDTAMIPQRGSVHAAGYDLYADEDTFVSPGGRAIVSTGIAVALPAGYEMQVRPRSGLAHKHGIMVTNAPGTVDADYRGIVCVLLFNTSKFAFDIKKGDRIAQAVFAMHETPEFQEVQELSTTVRGEGGFGSTGVATIA